MMTTIQKIKNHPWLAWLISESVVLSIILINTIAIFLDLFPSIHTATNGFFHWVDYACMIYFVIEAAIKIWLLGFHGYWQSGWNKMDFIIVIAGLPLLIDPFIDANAAAFMIAPLLRQGRFLRFWRMMRFIPHAAHIWTGVIRSLKASVGVFLVLFGLNFILAMGANVLFGQLAPEYFGNPLIAFYSMFKVFTIEGWFEIPDTLAEEGISSGWLTALRLYFSVAVLAGGILGLSLANAVFVDEMTADNNEELEHMIEELTLELKQARDETRKMREEQWALLQTTIREMQQELAALRLTNQHHHNNHHQQNNHHAIHKVGN